MKFDMRSSSGKECAFDVKFFYPDFVKVKNTSCRIELKTIDSILTRESYTILGCVKISNPNKNNRSVAKAYALNKALSVLRWNTTGLFNDDDIKAICDKVFEYHKRTGVEFYRKNVIITNHGQDKSEYDIIKPGLHHAPMKLTIVAE